MVDELNKALTILLVGMTTVFFILSVVVFVGNILIRILNKSHFILNQKDTSGEIPKDIEKVINATIMQWSKGKAKVTQISKN